MTISEKVSLIDRYVDLQIANFELLVRILYTLMLFLYFTKRKNFKNYERFFLFHLKISFHTRDIQIFVIFSLFPHFPDSKR